MIDPFIAGRKTALVGDVVVSVPVSKEVAEAINRVAESTHERLVEALDPFGLHPNDILVPEFRRAVYRDELAWADKEETP